MNLRVTAFLDAHWVHCTQSISRKAVDSESDFKRELVKSQSQKHYSKIFLLRSLPKETTPLLRPNYGSPLGGLNREIALYIII